MTVSSIHHLSIALSVAFFLAPTLVAPTDAHAIGLASDDFDTDGLAGDDLNGKNGGQGFTAPWTSAPGQVTLQTRTLNPPIGPVGSSLAAVIQPTANVGENPNIANRTFTASSAPVYVGFTIRPESLETDDFFQLYVSDGDLNAGSDTLSVGIRNSGSKPFFARVGGSGNTDNSAINAVNDEVYRIVAKFSKDGSGFFNRTDLFVDPSSDVEGIPDATQIGPLTDIIALNTLAIRLNSFETTDAIALDDLVISSKFAIAATAIPEPTSLVLWALLGLIGAGYALRFRRNHGER